MIYGAFVQTTKIGQIAKIWLAKRPNRSPNKKTAEAVFPNSVFSNLNPNVANLCRGKTHQCAPDVVARSLGQAETYLTVREFLAETSTVRSEQFGPELTAEGLTAEGERRWRALALV